MASNQQQIGLQDKFISRLGHEAFHSGWKSILALDPRFFSASLSLALVPHSKTNLSLKEQAFIAIAVDSAATHLYRSGIQAHIKTALKEGASANEVMEVIELSSTLGIHACNIKELIYCAFDAAATHLYVPGLKLHMRNALGYGATPQDILQVLEIATQLSLHTAHVAAPILEELMSTEGVSKAR
ncbi:hypothetical protein ACJZ2D_016218 [Fusarium nematophilum]